MRFRILVNECGIYRVERYSAQDYWILCTQPGVLGRVRQWPSREAAADWITEKLGEGEWRRKATTWTIVEELSS
jgi:hypothetical protein